VQYSKPPAKLPSLIHSDGSLLFVTPPMYCLDVVWMIVPPPSAHSFRIPMVGDDFVIIAKLFVANCAYAALLADLSVEQFPHLGRGSQLPVSARMMRIFDSLNTKSDHLGLG
jgi:hypothetical protein